MTHDRRSLATLAALLLSLAISACGREPDSNSAGAASDGPAPAVAADRAVGSASGAPAPVIETAASRGEPTRVLDPRADEILRAMSTHVASMRRFAFEAEEAYDELPGGQPRVLLTNLRRVAVERPNRVAADVEGDSLNRAVWFDGRSVTALDKTTLTYATFDASGSIDTALDRLSDRYGVNVPLADLLYADPYAILTETVTYSRYLGIHRAAGRPCHHLAFAQPTIEWQIWIDAVEKPLPRRLVITYVREPGEPQYAATITRWNVAPTFPDSLFMFEAPEGGRRVDAAALVPQLPGTSRGR